jgi:hypothetical protein
MQKVIKFVIKKAFPGGERPVYKENMVIRSFIKQSFIRSSYNNTSYSKKCRMVDAEKKCTVCSCHTNIRVIGGKQLKNPDGLGNPL